MSEKTFKGYKDLIVWQKAIIFVLSIYKLVSKFPVDERFALISQIKRAVLSVPANIAEGYSRCSKKELVRYLLIASGSLAEVETYLEISMQLGYINARELEVINQDKEEIRKMLGALIRSINK